MTFSKTAFQKKDNAPGFKKHPILRSSPTEFAIMQQNGQKYSKPAHLDVKKFTGIRGTPKASVCWSEISVMLQHLSTIATVSGGTICSDIVCGSIARQTFWKKPVGSGDNCDILMHCVSIVGYDRRRESTSRHCQQFSPQREESLDYIWVYLYRFYCDTESVDKMRHIEIVMNSDLQKLHMINFVMKFLLPKCNSRK